MNKITVDITDDIIKQIKDLDEIIEFYNTCDNPLQSAKNWFVGYGENGSLRDIWYVDLCFDIFQNRDDDKIKLSQKFNIADQHGNLTHTNLEFNDYRMF